MATITSAGIGSGMDIESLITKLVANERTPINQLQKRTEGLKTQLSAYGKLQGGFASLRDAAAKLTRPDSWTANLPSSTDPTSVTVSAGSSSIPGNFSVSVAQLASSQTVSSKVLPAAPGSVGSGILTIELGAWSADQSAFTKKDGTTAVQIDILPGEESITQIRDKINAAGAGVVASVVTDASGSRLVMRSSQTGETNGFRISVADTDGSVTDDAGLSVLAFDPAAGVASMSQNMAAANARATLNGLPISSESNTLKDAIDGLSITLLKPTTADVTLSVSQDKEGVKKAINDFVTAYNGLIGLMREQGKYDEANKSVGTLQGDATLIGLQGRLRSMAAGSTSLGGSLTRLADIGLDPGSDGSLKVNNTKLDKALGDLTQLKQLFAGVDATNAANNGLAQQLRSLADQVLSTDGSLSNRQKGLQDRIGANGKRSETLEDRVALTEKRLRARYTALDKQLGQLNGLSSYVSQQMNMLNRSG